MNKDTDKTIVIFRAERAGTFKGVVTAYFPATDAGNGLCECYMHVGQHSGADYACCVRKSRPATPAEYADVKRELETHYGYTLDVRKRWTR